MRLLLEMDCDNAAFEDNKEYEVARILRALADKMERGSDDTFRLMDFNGNKVGTATFVEA